MALAVLEGEHEKEALWDVYPVEAWLWLTLDGRHLGQDVTIPPEASTASTLTTFGISSWSRVPSDLQPDVGRRGHDVVVPVGHVRMLAARVGDDNDVVGF